MNLTIEDLNLIKKQCDNTSKIIKEIISSYQIDSDKRKLFVSRRDYEESLKIKNQIPQDFYYFRCFDIFIQIVYNKLQKVYQIYIDGYYSDILKKYKRVNEKSYIISNNFDEAYDVFNDLIQDVYSNKVILQNGLF